MYRAAFSLHLASAVSPHRRRLAGWMLSLALGAFASSAAPADNVRACRQGNVEFLVGGGSDVGCPGADDGPAPAAAARRRPRNTTAGEPVVSGDTERRGAVMQPDDQGRREILNQEMDQERRALARLSSTKADDPADQSQQMARHRANISALEAEIRRLK